MIVKLADNLVSKKFYRYLIPSFLSEMAMHMGSVIDSVIIGNLIGVEALSAVTLASPIIQVLHLPGLILDLGGATLATIWLDERKLKAASDIFDPTQYHSEEEGQFLLGGIM